MAVGNRKKAVATARENLGGEIKQIKEGDVTISFCDGRESHLSIKNYENQLNLFRKPRW